MSLNTHTDGYRLLEKERSKGKENNSSNFDYINKANINKFKI